MVLKAEDIFQRNWEDRYLPYEYSGTYNSAPRLLGLQEFAKFSHGCITLISSITSPLIQQQQTPRDFNLDFPQPKAARLSIDLTL